MVLVGGGGGEGQGNTGLPCLDGRCVCLLNVGRLCHMFCSVYITPEVVAGELALLELDIACISARSPIFGTRAPAGSDPGTVATGGGGGGEGGAASDDGGGKGGGS